ncbi:hypothetical protein PPERSA_09222 [Pseudocohnilembus persalinus]|uniref:Uncharacterized protein n=1 Tax=Pseudocohnilembus persalinus TaxID=266149 RepID=A0A0V0R4L5_PSEPJ|nr:hypothetical protein PPERSA_09222 [Pseudocohnilembus persalinus]|eukprot:KRX09338.1 hypothetical protein PPERSA_09222 [Pseudocohnilembus persalinus]
MCAAKRGKRNWERTFVEIPRNRGRKNEPVFILIQLVYFYFFDFGGAGSVYQAGNSYWSCFRAERGPVFFFVFSYCFVFAEEKGGEGSENAGFYQGFYFGEFFYG